MLSETEILSRLITGRGESFFQADLNAQQDYLCAVIPGSTWLIAGGAGSIGSAFIQALLPFQPERILIIDPDENALARCVRNIRNAFLPEVLPEIKTYSIALGHTLFPEWLNAQKPIDYIFSFAARKHVRAERDIYSAISMLECNILSHHQLLQCLSTKKVKGVFFVSTDKAADPVSLMGASKRIMEHLLFSYADYFPVQTLRFANVLFSAGSITESFLHRYRSQQAFACPGDIQRYFISEAEAGHMCLLAAMGKPDKSVWIPALDPKVHLQPITDALIPLLVHWGIVPYYCTDEREAVYTAMHRKSKDPWPVLITRTNTSGEKAIEIFKSKGEKAMKDNRYTTLHALTPVKANAKSIQQMLKAIQSATESPEKYMPEVFEWMEVACPGFVSPQMEGSLDDKV
jgi:FlaA1/EpsC-like NDP-sugar epimerase